jgi:hypothetical protein
VDSSTPNLFKNLASDATSTFTYLASLTGHQQLSTVLRERYAGDSVRILIQRILSSSFVLQYQTLQSVL